MYDQNGKLTREAMEKIIREGGSVLLHRDPLVDERGFTYFHPLSPIEKVSDLPSAAEVAGDDPVRRAKAKVDLLKEQERIAQQLALLQEGESPEAPGSWEAEGNGQGFDAETAEYRVLVEKAVELGIAKPTQMPKIDLIAAVKTALVQS